MNEFSFYHIVNEHHDKMMQEKRREVISEPEIVHVPIKKKKKPSLLSRIVAAIGGLIAVVGGCLYMTIMALII